MMQAGRFQWVWGVVLGASAVGASAHAGVVDQLERELIAAVNRVRPSVVAIKIHQAPWPGAPVHDRWASGVVVDRHGHVVTVGVTQVRRDGKLEVTDHQGQTHSAHFVGYDSHENLTVLKIDPGRGRVPSVPMGPDAPPCEGTLIIAAGNAYGYSGTVTYGNVSGLNRSIGVGGVQRAGLIQFTAPINPGDSGGCLANAHGQMIGVIASTLAGPPWTWQAHRGRASVPLLTLPPQAIGFAVPVARVRRVVAALTAGGRVERGYLGVYGRPGPEGQGAHVLRVIPGSPAEKAGLQPDDTITSFAKQAIHGFEDLRLAVERTKPGTTVAVVVRRGGATVTLRVAVGEKPVAKVQPSVGPYGDWRDVLPRGVPGEIDKWLPPGARAYVYGQHKPLLGVRTQELSPQMRQRLGLPAGKGVLIAEVLPNTPAANVGLQAADILLRVDDTDVDDPGRLPDVLRRIGPGKRVRLTLKRDKTDLVVVVRLAQVDAPKAGHWHHRRPGLAPDVEKEYRRRIEDLEKQIKQMRERLKRLPQTQPSR